MRIPSAVLACALLAPPCFAQGSPDPLPENYIKVSAPLAQTITLRTKAAHPEITKLGLHATPEGTTENAIISNITPSKIGKKSSPGDMQRLATAQPFVTRVDKAGIYDLLLPIADRKGKSIGDGFVVMEVPFDKAANEQEALKIGTTVRDEIQQEIPSKAALYR